MTLRRTMVSVLAFWMVAMLLPTDASASFRLRVEDISASTLMNYEHGFGIVVSDDGVGDSNDQPGIVNVTLNGLGGGVLDEFGEFQPNVQTTFGFTKPVLEPPANPFFAQMLLGSVSVVTTGAMKLQLTLEDDNYLPGAPGDLIYTSTLAPNSDSTNVPLGFTVTSRSFVSASNYTPALGADTAAYCGELIEEADADDEGCIFTNDLNLKGQPIAAQLSEIGPNTTDTFTSPLGFGTGSPVLESSVGFTANTPPPGYSLWTQITIEFFGAGRIEFGQDNRVTVNSETGPGVPEPASLLLIATGVIGGLARARRRRNATRTL